MKIQVVVSPLIDPFDNPIEHRVIDSHIRWIVLEPFSNHFFVYFKILLEFVDTFYQVFRWYRIVPKIIRRNESVFLSASLLPYSLYPWNGNHLPCYWGTFSYPDSQGTFWHFLCCFHNTSLLALPYTLPSAVQRNGVFPWRNALPCRHFIMYQDSLQYSICNFW